MKKIYGFLGAVAILSMVACSKDDIDGPNAPDAGTKGDFFMTMNISHKESTRTSTPNQGYEVGKDFENKISSALLILAKPDATTGYKIFATSGKIGTGGFVDGGTSTPGIGDSGNHTGDKDDNGSIKDNAEGAGGLESVHTNTYKASFTFNRKTLQDDLTVDVVSSDPQDQSHPNATKKQTYYIFVVANPTDDIVNKAVANADVQQVFAMAANNKQYWSDDNFLMSSADVAIHTIYDDEIALGTHTTKAEAYNLGSVFVQRAMSRFDLNVSDDHLVFQENPTSQESGQSTLPGVKVTFDAVALVNMAKSANLFKTMALKQANLGQKTILFGDERQSQFADYWVFTPNQYTTESGTSTYSFYNPLFTDGSVTFTGESLTGTTLENATKLNGTAVSFESLFEGEEGASWTSMETIKSNFEDNTFEHEGHNPSTLSGYRIWRYAMENTNPDETCYQKNGNSTGVVYRAKLENNNGGTAIPTDGSDIYAYNNVILGNAARLKDFATNPIRTGYTEDEEEVYQNVKTIYNAAVKAKLIENRKPAQEGKEWDFDTDGYKEDATWKETKKEDGTFEIVYGELSDLDEYLVQEGFNIYDAKNIAPTGSAAQYVYYCYYTYWNRHNDNGSDMRTIMGIMEFATVRNNVYKLSVNKVLRLGHPGKPENDPDTPDPDDPDEKDEFWLEVDCEILPWEVRINEVEF